MDQRFRRGFTAAEKTELWGRWQRGESLKAIGRAFGKQSSLFIASWPRCCVDRLNRQPKVGIAAAIECQRSANLEAIDAPQQGVP